jgi:hypothetical protein
MDFTTIRHPLGENAMANPAGQDALVARLRAQNLVESEADMVSPRGNKYHLIKTTERDEYEPQEKDSVAALEAKKPAPADNFTGKDRKAAKLSIGTGRVENSDLQQVLKSLPTDASMGSHKPPITLDPTSGRVTEEQRNVKVRAFLYAASREADNDFHFIVGHDAKLPTVFMNMELSGLPPAGSPSSAAITNARNAYKAFLAAHPTDHVPGPGYVRYVPPVPIEVQGSLFFDITHLKGTHPGPHDIRPNTVWEIHPITAITFEP